MGRRERLLFAEARFVSARLALQGAGSPTSLWWCAHYDAFERARMALREAVLMAEANTSVGHQYFAMPHGWTHWAADAQHTTACRSVAKVEDGHG